jgi:serine/threonine protein kinase
LQADGQNLAGHEKVPYLALQLKWEKENDLKFTEATFLVRLDIKKLDSYDQNYNTKYPATYDCSRILRLIWAIDYNWGHPERSLFYPFCNRFDLIAAHMSLNFSNKLTIMQHASEGLCYLHKNNWVHSDIKLDNILVNFDPISQTFEGVIGDIEGICPVNTYKIRFGTPTYLAPELQNTKYPTQGGDLYALGTTINALFFYKEDVIPYPEIKARLKRLGGDLVQKQPQNRPLADTASTIFKSESLNFSLQSHI